MPIAFSLLIPSYNRPDMIREAVDSLIANQSAEVEIIVGDDASPRQAEIRAVLADLIEQGNISFLGHSKNGGWSMNRNQLVAAARGEWVILMGDDDRLKPGAVSRIRHWMGKHPGHDVYAFGYDIIDSEGCFVYGRSAPRPIVYRLGTGSAWEELFYMDAIQMWSHHPFTMAIRRRVALANPFDPAAGIADDILFQLRHLIRGSSILAIPESLFEWRFAISPKTTYQNLSADNTRSLRAHRQIWLLMLQDQSLPPAVAALIRTPQWIRRFLRSSPPTTRRLAGRAAKGETFPEGLEDPDFAMTLVEADSRWEQARKLTRVARVFGGVHYFNVAKYFLERYCYRIKADGAFAAETAR